jgi:hypothetical protein
MSGNGQRSPLKLGRISEPTFQVLPFDARPDHAFEAMPSRTPSGKHSFWQVSAETVSGPWLAKVGGAEVTLYGYQTQGVRSACGSTHQFDLRELQGRGCIFYKADSLETDKQ